MISSEGKIVEELFNESATDFHNHLNIRDNDRIIFSGRFGIGKTTFLRDYFFSGNGDLFSINPSQYNVFHIFPVNYSIASNEDIFRYIKYDILLELFEKGVVIDDIKLDLSQTGLLFFKNNSLSVATNFLTMIPLIGKELSGAAEKIDSLIKKFSEFERETYQKTSNLESLHNYLQSVEKERGSIYEQDVITQILRNELEKFKKNSEGKNSKENVLIIDDLDRIDPEHIFRVLNVFAAHFDNRNGKNKLGFDKVIVVCDIQNIRQIYRAKYGVKTDFNGYIDKFYSSHIFEFNPYKTLLSIVIKAAYDIRVDSNARGGNIRKSEMYFSRSNTRFLTAMVEWLVSNKEIDLRNVLKLKNLAIKDQYRIEIRGWALETEIAYSIVWGLRILSLLKGDYLSLIESIERTDQLKSFLDENEVSNFLIELLLLMNYSRTSGFHATPIEYNLANGEAILLTKLPDGNYQVSITSGHKVGNWGKIFQGVLVDTIKFLKTEGTLEFGVK